MDWSMQPADTYAATVCKRLREPINDMGTKPWERGGWFECTTGRVTGVLVELGYKVVGSFQQYKVDYESVLLIIETTKGRLSMKVTHRAEVLVVKCASEFASFVVPVPLHVNDEQDDVGSCCEGDGSWMILHDYGPTLEDSLTVWDSKAIHDLYGRLQVESMKYRDKLSCIGIPVVTSDYLITRTDRMIKHPQIVAALHVHDVFNKSSPSQFSNGAGSENKGFNETRFCELIRIFFRLLYDGQDMKLPITLTHGDLNPGNLIKVAKCPDGRPGTSSLSKQQGNEGCVIIDWYNATLDVPFNDLRHMSGNVDFRSCGWQ